MKTIAELITFYEDRIKYVDVEMERLVAMVPSGSITDDDIVGWNKDWATERAIFRDTLSYLKTLERRGVAA